MLCDELGINCMINEHHASATCISESPNVQLAILARQTKNVRLLALGHPIAVRSDPIRLAEEIAMIDCISRGRLEIGFVKGAPYEYSPANANPVRITERFWEANDLILKTLSTRDGPFNFEGNHHHFRQVNIWPRPWQHPHPPVWVTAGSPESTLEVAQRQHRIAVFLAGWNVKQAVRSLPASGPPKWASPPRRPSDSATWRSSPWATPARRAIAGPGTSRAICAPRASSARRS